MLIKTTIKNINKQKKKNISFNNYICNGSLSYI